MVCLLQMKFKPLYVMLEVPQTMIHALHEMTKLQWKYIAPGEPTDPTLLIILSIV